MSGTAPQVGEHFGPYLLTRVIGTGGMGRVYEAHDPTMDRTVALKLISGPYAQDPEYRQRLQREARIAGRLQDPHVVPIHAAGEIDGQLYVDMRLIHGTDLATVLQRSGPLPPARAVAIVSQVASALDAAHAAGVLHRDVKPGNILLTADDFAYLVDFGIANAATEVKVTQLGDVLGTWAYMAPERFGGDDTAVTSRSDIYALACVLFEALTGSPPFSGDQMSLIGAHLNQPVPRASMRRALPPGLDDVIARGMAKAPEHRYATAGEFARAAQAASAGSARANAAPTLAAHVPSPAAAGPPTAAPYAAYPETSQPAPRTNRRRRWLLVASAIAVVIALAAGIGIWRLTGGKHAQAGVDLGKLDVGRYPTQPQPLSGTATETEGKYLEAFRLAEGIANPYRVDPELSHLYGMPVPDPAAAASAISGTGTPLVQPVLEQYGMISAYLVQGMSQRVQDMARGASGEALLIMVTSFPNDDAAARAATDMEATDFGVNPDNQPATIPGYPQAKSHYRPGWSSVAATMASGRLVTSVLARSDATPDLAHLTQRIQDTFDIQVPLLAKLLPLTTAGLTTLPLDPDNMLSRIFVAGDRPPVSAQFGSMGPRAAELCVSGQELKEDLLEQAEVDRCAFSTVGQLLRARDETSASALLPKLIQAQGEYVDHEVASPDGLTDAKCFENKQEIWSDNPNVRFACWVSFGRYVANIISNEEADARQRIAAQYAILVNSA